MLSIWSEICAYAIAQHGESEQALRHARAINKMITGDWGLMELTPADDVPDDIRRLIYHADKFGRYRTKVGRRLNGNLDSWRFQL